MLPNNAASFYYGGPPRDPLLGSIFLSFMAFVLLSTAVRKKIIDIFDAALIVGLVLFFVFAYFYDNNLLQP